MPEKPSYEELEQKVKELEASESKSNRMLEALQQKEYLYGNLFKNMLHEVHVWKLVFDDYGKIKTWKLIDANPTALKSWDRTLSEVVGKTTDEIFPDSGAREQFMPIVKKIFSEGTPHIWELYFEDTNQFLHMVSIPLGEYFISTGLDITERRQTEEALRQKHEMLKRTEAIAHVGSWEWKIETNTVTWSEELYRIFQLDPDSAAPNWAQHPKLYHPEDFEKLRQAVETAIADGKPYELELRAFRKDGETRICNAIGFSERGKDGDVVRLVGLLQDITDRKQTEKDLSQIFSMSLDMICIADINTATFLKVNPAFTEILGYSEEELLEKTFLDFVHPDDIEATRTVIEQKLQSGSKVINFENRYRCVDGSYRWLSWVSHPNIKQGVTYAVARDITEWKQYEEELKKSNDLLDSTGRMAKVGGWELDADTMEVTWTEETYRIHEVPLDYKPPLKEAINFFHPEDRDRLSQAVQRSLDHGEPYDMELRFISANGNHLWARTKCEPEVFDGKVIKLKGTFQDITERKQAEEALQARERELKQILDATTDGIWTWNFKSNKLTFSPKYYTMLGYEPNAFPADYENWLNLMHPDDRQKALAVAEEYLKTKPDTYENEFRLRTSTGDYRWIHASARVAERDINGDAAYMIGNHQDITASREAEEALRKSEEQYRLLVDTANDAIFIAQDGVILFPNPKTTDITGYSADELANMQFTDIIHPEDRDLVLGRHLQRLKGKNPPSNYSFRIKNKAGEELLVQINAALISWEDRPATINIIRDITEQKQLEDRLRDSQKMESIGSLAGGIAHDFNNILFPIVGMSEMLLEDLPAGSPERENAEEIFRAGKRGSDLVKQILAFSRQSEHKMMPTRIQNILKEVIKLSRSTIPTYIEIKQDIQQDCGMVLADPSQIHQIGMNIITNAYHALEAAGGTISVTLRQKVIMQQDLVDLNIDPGGYAILSITDNGHGIPVDLIGKIFDPYFTTKEQGKGTGLGLAVVYGIVKEHGGDIKVFSEIGKGSTFEIYLPLMKKANGTESTPKPEEYKGGYERILLVDDEESIVKLEKQMLERLGYDVTSRISGVDALAAFKANPSPYDLVVTDMSMPNIPGDKLAQEIKSIRSDVPIIICTGFSERIHEDNFKQMGIDGLLMKPIVKSELAKTVRKLLDEAKSESCD